MDKEASFLVFSSDLDNASHANRSDAISTSRAFERVIRIVVPVIFGLIAVLGFAGNLLVITVVALNRQMRSTTNLLIICLATADLVFIVICVPFTAVSYAIPTWSFGITWCKIYQYVIHASAYVSVYTLVLMSFDRYLAVVHPINSMTLRTRTKTTLVIAVIYLLIGTLTSLTFNDFEVISYDFIGERRSSCVHVRSFSDRSYGRLFYGCFFAFAYIVPLGSICLLYGLMIWKLFHGMPKCSGSRSLAAKTQCNRRVTLMVVVVVVVFAVCWFPIQIVLIVQVSEANLENGTAFVTVKIAATCLAYVNSCVNPFLYAFLSESFRKGFWNLLRCRDGLFNCCCCSCCRDRSFSHRPETVGLITTAGKFRLPDSNESRKRPVRAKTTETDQLQKLTVGGDPCNLSALTKKAPVKETNDEGK